MEDQPSSHGTASVDCANLRSRAELGITAAAAIPHLLNEPIAFLHSIQGSNRTSCIRSESALSDGYVNLGHGTASASAESSNAAIARLLKGPDDFLDSLPDFEPCIPINDQCAADPREMAAASPTGSSTAMENSIISGAETDISPSNSFQGGSCRWMACLCHDCCWKTWAQRRHRHRHRPHPPSHYVSESTANAAPVYSRIFPNVRSFGSSIYSSLSRLHSQPSSHGPSNPQNPKKKRPPSALEKYESKKERVRWAARLVGSFYNLSTFLAVCSLTWATVVLLGAFVSSLPFIDYAMITCLVLLEAIRLASAAFFTILLTHGLARQSQDPENIIHGKDDHYRRAFAARILSSILQAIMILPSFICPIIRFPNIRYPGQNLYVSLFIFYTFIIINATVSSFTLICSSASFIHLRDRYDQSVLRFYDELVQRAIFFGVIQADEFGFFEFAYRLLGSEYARIIQPEAVVKNHRKLIEYLYWHRLGQDFVAIFIDDGDAFVQQAAVNMAGFWADPSKKVGLREVKITKRVLTKMADKVGAGQVGWAATNSFGGIARRDPSILEATRTSDGTPLLEKLAELVDGKSSGSLVYVRTLALFYHYTYKKGEVVPVLEQERELAGKLKRLLADAKVRRARLFAAYLLHLMRRLDEECYDAVFDINPIENDTYWFKVELDLLNFVREKCHNMDPMRVPEGFIREDDNICPRGDKYL